ncbi:putative mediator of rna polymerase ii transcription subunit 5 protein [Phaeoacremonium minimum UCRPA7]|uniref:Mediator of RNA polymerase II transcription subunit 5 n=1 Tax=Phaeoacremonium minimum (strain UCR-PA7) TaxID=1286976 RepID=R8BU84_PHAM7|nr:putative mediator of rna polymerase ii transcription subunit 5 protein [Phaeoacremonium minimum UCRPA7]EOO02926.1 putative mediator of rna polymerase ii transcription subunit 5 protein [Phaeoacremonium minimum UCRPA7]
MLHIIVEEMKQLTEAGSGSVAYDVGTALVCAPDVTSDDQPLTISLLDESGNVPASPQRRISLREALKWEAEEWKKIQKTDPVMAETVVRLYRKVEAQMVVTQAPTVLQTELGTLEGAALDDAMAAAAAAASAVPDDAMTIDTTGMGLGLGTGGGDLSLGASSANSAGGLDLGADNDIFSGLGSLDGWDGMDGMDLS